MMARPVAEFLVCFGSSDRSEVDADSVAAVDSMAAVEEAPIDVGALLIEAARADGFAAGQAAAEATHTEALAAERCAFAARLAAERTRWVTQESAVLADKIALASAEIEERIGASVARILRSFLAERLIETAVRDLAEHVRVLLSGKEHRLIRISGPDDLVGKLRERFAGELAAIEFGRDPSTDVEIVADETVIESRIAAWMDRIGSEPE